MANEYFVTKLMAGHAHAPRRIQWWVDHSNLSMGYLSSKGGAGIAAKAIFDRGAVCAVEWDGLIHAEGLMAEHAGLEHAMVDAAFNQNLDRESLVVISEFMTENVEKQVNLSMKIQDFPSHAWRMLLLDHVRIFVETVRWQIIRDQKRIQGCQERWRGNALSLSAFSAEWF